MAESLSINGTSLYTYLESIHAAPGLVGAPPIRGGDYETPLRPGATNGTRWAGPRVASIYGVLYGGTDGRAGYLDKIRGLSALVWNDGDTYTVTRVLPRVSGGDLTVEATGRYGGGLESIQQAAHHAGRCTFDIVFLDSYWFDSSTTTLSAITGSATPTIAGDVATRNLTLTFSGATAVQRLTNNTTGQWVEVLGNTSADTVLDCTALSATRSGSSKAGDVSHNADFDDWMTLPVGSNSLTLTGGGQVVVAYRGAYL